MKKGFTLIELLAVIIILAVIALITIPLVINTIDDARGGSFKDSAYGIISAAEQKQAKEALKNGGKLQVQTYDLTGTDLSYKGSKPKAGKAIVNGKGQVALEMNNGTLCITKGYTDKDVKVTTVSDDNPCDGRNVGLTPEACFVTADNTDGGVTITGYTCEEMDVVIPSKIGGKNVTAIGELAFWNNHLISVVIPDSVTSIGQGAFGRNELTSAIIGNGVTTIGDAAFGRNHLKEIVIPDSVTTIEGWAFHNNNIESLVIGEGVTTIGKCAFSWNSLNSATIPSSVTSLGECAFDYSRNIINNSSQTYTCSMSCFRTSMD